MTFSSVVLIAHVLDQPKGLLHTALDVTGRVPERRRTAEHGFLACKLGICGGEPPDNSVGYAVSRETVDNLDNCILFRSTM